MAIAEEIVKSATGACSKKGSAGAGYKEVWHLDNFKKSWVRNGYYEAGGCLTWVHPFSNTSSQDSVPEEEHSWSEVEHLEQRLAARVWNEANKEESIIFPLPLVGYISKDCALDKYPNMIFLHFGTALVYAWWSKMFKAIRDQQHDVVLQLWTAACGVTLRVHKVRNHLFIFNTCQMHNLRFMLLE